MDCGYKLKYLYINAEFDYNTELDLYAELGSGYKLKYLYVILT